jgi:hypothetical protein
MAECLLVLTIVIEVGDALARSWVRCLRSLRAVLVVTASKKIDGRAASTPKDTLSAG